SAARLEFGEAFAMIRQWPRRAVKDTNGWRFARDSESCVLRESDGGTEPEGVAAKKITQQLQGRPTYADAIIENVLQAKFRVHLAVHTLLPSSEPRVQKLQEALRTKIEAGCDVRVLAPCGPDRLKAAFELRLKGIPTKHLAFLEDEDLRFTLVDE